MAFYGFPSLVCLLLGGIICPYVCCSCCSMVHSPPLVVLLLVALFVMLLLIVCFKYTFTCGVLLFGFCVFFLNVLFLILPLSTLFYAICCYILWYMYIPTLVMCIIVQYFIFSHLLIMLLIFPSFIYLCISWCSMVLSLPLFVLLHLALFMLLFITCCKHHPCLWRAIIWCFHLLCYWYFPLHYLSKLLLHLVMLHFVLLSTLNQLCISNMQSFPFFLLFPYLSEIFLVFLFDCDFFILTYMVFISLDAFVVVFCYFV